VREAKATVADALGLDFKALLKGTAKPTDILASTNSGEVIAMEKCPQVLLPMKI